MGQAGQGASAHEREWNNKLHKDEDIKEPNLPAPPTDLEEQIRHAIAESFGFDPDEVWPLRRIDDFNVDSLDLVELICELEERFRIQIPEEVEYATSSMRIVKDWIDLVVKLDAAKKPTRKKRVDRDSGSEGHNGVWGT